VGHPDRALRIQTEPAPQVAAEQAVAEKRIQNVAQPGDVRAQHGDLKMVVRIQ
jgi:hypothetical protein